MAGARKKIEALAKRFPSGLKHEIALDRTEFVMKAIEEVVHTLIEAIVIMVAVTYLFLQNWRATLIGIFGPMAASVSRSTR